MVVEQAQGQRMNVLILSNKSPFPPNDGSSLAVESMVRGFVDRGLRVGILAMNTSKHHKLERDVPEDLIGKISLRMVEVDNKPTPIGGLVNLLLSRDSYVVTRFDSLAYAHALENWLQEDQFHFVQIEGLSLAHYLPIVRKYHLGPAIMRSHNVEHLIWSRTAMYEANPLKRWYLRLQADRLKSFELEAMAKFNAVVPITSTDTAAFKSLGLQLPMQTAFCGVEVPEKPQQLLNSTPDFFFVGAFDWLPNLQGMQWLLKEVWPKILHAIPNAQLHVLGRHCPDTFKQHMGVQVHPDRSIARSFFEEHHILLVPLRSGSGLRIKIVEAMSLGKAVVSTYIGAEGIHGQSGTHFYVDDDPNVFAEKAILLAQDAQLRAYIAGNAHTFALKHFDREAISTTLLNFYQSL